MQLGRATVSSYIPLRQTGFTTSLRHRKELWALTPLVSPLPTMQSTAGGFVSVALSLRLPSVAASNCLALCRPDFPPRIS